MRVLLPLRKPPLNSNQSSSSSCDNLSELEHAETASVVSSTCAHSSEGEAATTRGGLPSDFQALQYQPGELTSFLLNPLFTTTSGGGAAVSELQLPLEQQQQQQQHPNRGLPPVERGSWKTTGLQPFELDRKRPGASPRKRPRPSGDEIQKRPALEKKPPAKPSVNMGLGPAGRKAVAQNSHAFDGNSSIGSNLGRPLVMRNSADEGGEDSAIAMNSNIPDYSQRSTTKMAQSVSGDDDDDDDAHDFFLLELKKRGLEIREQEGDGNCLFRAVSLQVYGDPSMHGQVRQQCLDFMERDKEHFAQFVTGEDFTIYIQRKRQDGVHGNNPEIQAISELFNRPIEVFSPEKGAAPLNIFHAEYKTDDAPIRLSYHDGNHYNAVVDPLVPTAGLGLGLPGLQPGLADKQQMAKAVLESDATADQMELQRALKESQDDELQRAIKESKLSTEHMRSNEAMARSDVDATYFELEQAALEHSLESHLQFEHGKKQKASPSTMTTDQNIRENSTIENIALPPSLGGAAAAAAPAPLSAVASLPTSSANVSSEARIPVAAFASVAPFVASAAASVASAASPVAAAAASKCDEDTPTPIREVDEYPPVVQEMVMNGFDIVKVVRAVEFIGDNFDDVLAFLMSNTS